MTKKISPSRLGSNMPETRGMSAFFGNSVAEQGTEVTSDDILEISDIAETHEVAKEPEKKLTQETPRTKVTATTKETPAIPVALNELVTPKTAAVPQKKKVRKTKIAPAATVATGVAEFTPTRGLPQGWERHTYVIQTKHVELIEAAAYWDRMDKKDILQASLDAFFKGRKVKPLPQEKRRERKARPSTKK